MLEDEDLVGAYGHHYLGNVCRVVPPPDDVKTDYAIVRELARRVGLESRFSESAREWKRKLLSRVEPHGVSLEALERGAVRNPLVPEVLFANREFPTETGKVNLIHEIDPEPPRPTTDRPLLLMALSTKDAQASQWSASRQNGPTVVTVHPDSADGLREGDAVRLSSDVGSITVRLALDDQQRPDVALMPKGGWYRSGRCANSLVRARATDAGGGAVYYDTPVRLSPIEESSS
jgi:anaerobic selenocysteine-containing dehydrogenase